MTALTATGADEPDEPTEREVCFTCKYWRQGRPAGQQGQCRRFPPTVIDITDRRWPITHPSDWCGEWRNKDF